MALPDVRLALLLLAICACERATTTPPPPAQPDPLEQARAEFELVPADRAIGTHKLYSRGDFSADLSIEDQFDEGDFIGRLRTLFGPREGNEYVLRHRKTGLVITAYSAKSGPAYGGAPRDDEHVIAQRKAADPLLAAQPKDPDFRTLQRYAKHVSDAEAGPELAAVIARLDALVEAVPPADWEKIEFYDEGPGVFRIGAKHGKSFNVELAPEDAFDFLAKDAESRDPAERDELGGITFAADLAVVTYYVAHIDELASRRARALAAHRRFLVEANSYTGELRRSLLDESRELEKQLYAK